MAVPSPVAIIGMSCRFPGASCPEELEQLLLNGVSSWGPIPADRWNSAAFYHAQQGASESLAAKHGYFLKDDISKFDARFFQVPPQEAHAMDPQQRILLQTTYEALENAGLPLEDVRGSNTSVFISAFAYDYQRMGYKDLAEVSGSHVAGTGMAMLSNRISYVFDLTGASLTLDTGCVSCRCSLPSSLISFCSDMSTGLDLYQLSCFQDIGTLSYGYDAFLMNTMLTGCHYKSCSLAVWFAFTRHARACVLANPIWPLSVDHNS